MKMEKLADKSTIVALQTTVPSNITGCYDITK